VLIDSALPRASGQCKLKTLKVDRTHQVTSSGAKYNWQELKYSFCCYLDPCKIVFEKPVSSSEPSDEMML